MTVQSVDFTSAFNASNNATFDVSQYDFVVVRLNTVTSTVNFQASVDDTGNSTLFGAGSAETATDFYSVQGVNLATGAGATSLASGSATFRFERVGKFLNFNKTGVTATKVILHLMKIA
jgi:hypothetical protein